MEVRIEQLEKCPTLPKGLGFEKDGLPTIYES
jgi:hypothetical protein